ncbi:MAG TPA: penicillin-binding protein activator [Candidatus Alistipes intestinigallinarum]|uniref:Penicillin-binding protein activator n=1 Tax=Candidatus Alistipes intestinigallinarum TaxID=2838440 RepID=A0A9D2CCV1_9BACT|nr:penicillin-binding protein activator [Candidatus Alistipes intestinigallinarum]
MKRLCATLLTIMWGFSALAGGKSETIVYINGAKYYIHTVQAGETLYGLAKTYGVGEQVILENNPSIARGLQTDTNIKIPYVAAAPEPKSERKLRKTFDFHYVAKGETLYAISRQYEIPVKTLLEDNPNLDPLHMRLGERILIRKKQIGSEDEAGTQEQWEEYRQSLNSVADAGTSYHIVHPGETFYSLSRRFGITEEELSRLNGGLKPAELKAGAMIVVPGTGRTEIAAADTLRQDSLPALREVEPIEFRALRRSDPLNVALLLPVSVNGQANDNYLDFYQGFLLGLDSVKQKSGYSVNVELFNTARDTARIREIVSDAAFRKADLVVGPVYEEGLETVVRFAEEKRIPVVSPLANIERMNSDVLFQLAPDPARKYEKVEDLVGDGKRVTLIYTSTTDKEFEREVLALLGNRPFERYNYRYEHPSSRGANSPSDLTPLLENDADNVFVILSDSEVDVDRILAALASADTSITARGRTAPRFTVLGNARWNRYNNLDRAIFFKDRVVFISTYHAKRDSEAVKAFDRVYLRSFGMLPTLFSYRGYDTAMIFAPAMYGDIEYDLEDRRFTPLQTTYLFSQPEGRANHVNHNWTRVNYHNDFTITIE